MAILAKVPGSRHDNLLYLKIFFILNKKQARRAQGFHVCDKKCQTAIFRQRHNPPLNTKSKQIVYSVSGCFLKIKKKPFGLHTWKGQLKPRVLLELPLLVTDVRSLNEADCHLRRPYKYVESFDKAAIRHYTILHCEETVADSKYSELNPG